MRGSFFLLPLVAFLISSGCEEPEKILPSSPLPPIEDGPVEALSRAYLTRDLGLFASLLANDPATHAEFVFLFNRPTSQGETEWDRGEELRLNHRMFHPESPGPGEPEVPGELWMTGLSITFTRLEEFQERPDLYSENDGLDGKLDSRKWRARDARYATYLLLECGENDYLVDTETNFVVIEDLTKQGEEEGKFLIYRWEEFCSSPTKGESEAVLRLCLSHVKDSYR